MCKNGQTMFAPERLQDDPFGPLYCRDDRMYVKDKYRDKNNRKLILKFPLFLEGCPQRKKIQNDIYFLNFLPPLILQKKKFQFSDNLYF